MQKHNPVNERIKRRYITYLREAQRYSAPSLDTALKAIHRFESYGKFRDFKAFHIQQAVAFKQHLAEQTNARTGEPLSKATLYATTAALRKFFIWLAGQPGYRSHFSYSDAEFFNLSEKDVRVAKASREQPVPTIEQIRHVVFSMPTRTDIELRNRALIAFIFLTGARDGAVASMKLKHVDISAECVSQDAREVRTKFSKTFPTYFFPVGGEVRQVVSDWITHLRETLLWSPDDPLFPATKVEIGADQQFAASGLDRKQWTNATPIRRIFRDAFTAAGLPYFPPHSFRKTLVQLGQKVCRTPEQFKAWSQNLGHEQVLTTFASYGAVASYRQAEIIGSLAKATQPDADLLSAMQEAMRAAERHVGLQK
jgi:integrase